MADLFGLKERFLDFLRPTVEGWQCWVVIIVVVVEEGAHESLFILDIECNPGHTSQSSSHLGFRVSGGRGLLVRLCRDLGSDLDADLPDVVQGRVEALMLRRRPVLRHGRGWEEHGNKIVGKTMFPFFYFTPKTLN